METPSTWAQVRAGLLAAIIGINLLSATPVPMRLSPAHFERPDAQEELQAWLDLLHDAGVPVERDQLVEQLIAATDAYLDLRSAWIGQPTAIPRRWLGIRQNWALFARPDTFPTTLAVDVQRAGGTWEEVYRSLDPEHRTLAPQLRYRRIRGLYDVGGRPAAPYHNLSRWVADQLFASDPAIERVRLRMIRSHVVHPGAPSDPSQTVLHRKVFERGDR